MLACMYCYRVAVPNPYLMQQWSVVGMLVVTFALWTRVRPPAVWVLRLPAMLAAFVTLYAMFAIVFGVDGSVEPECRLALKASLLLTGSLAGELFDARRRERIPRAVARWLLR
jgi:hypothetical protein